MKLFGTIGGRERQTCISCKKDMSWPSRFSRIRGGNTYEQSPPPSWRRRGPARPPELAAVASFAVVLGWPFHDAACHHDLCAVRRFGLAAPASTVKVSPRTRADRPEPEIHRLLLMDPRLWCFTSGSTCSRHMARDVCGGHIRHVPAFATVSLEAMGIANAMSGKTRQQINEAMTAILRMSASFPAAPEWRRR